MGKKYTGELPKDIEMSGMLAKGGGQDGKKKRQLRFFTLGNNLMAYFNCKDLGGAKPDKVKGCLKVKGARAQAGQDVKTKNETLYEFKVSSAGRTYLFYAPTDKQRTEWVDHLSVAIEYTGQRDDTQKKLEELASGLLATENAYMAKQREIYDQVSSALQSRGDNIRGICTEFNNDHDAVEATIVETQAKIHAAVDERAFEAVPALANIAQAAAEQKLGYLADMGNARTVLDGSTALLDEMQASIKARCAKFQQIMFEALQNLGDDAPELPPPPEPEVVYHEELEDKIRDAEDDEFATAGAEDAGEDA